MFKLFHEFYVGCAACGRKWHVQSKAEALTLNKKAQIRYLGTNFREGDVVQFVNLHAQQTATIASRGFGQCHRGRGPDVNTFYHNICYSVVICGENGVFIKKVEGVLWFDLCPVIWPPKPRETRRDAYRRYYKQYPELVLESDKPF